MNFSITPITFYCSTPNYKYSLKVNVCRNAASAVWRVTGVGRVVHDQARAARQQEVRDIPNERIDLATVAPHASSVLPCAVAVRLHAKRHLVGAAVLSAGLVGREVFRLHRAHRRLNPKRVRLIAELAAAIRIAAVTGDERRELDALGAERQAGDRNCREVACVR